MPKVRTCDQICVKMGCIFFQVLAAKACKVFLFIQSMIFVFEQVPNPTLKKKTDKFPD